MGHLLGAGSDTYDDVHPAFRNLGQDAKGPAETGEHMPGRRQELRDKTIYPSDPHMRIKHRIYRGYLNCWMPKILQADWHEGAVVFDAFSGAGYYSDGLEGSPVLVARTFLEHQARLRFKPLQLVTLEERQDRTEALRAKLAAMPSCPGFTPSVQDPGEFSTRRQGLASTFLSHREPSLWLIDPWGLKQIPFDDVAACVAQPGQEAIVSLMLDEMHRFKTQPKFESTLNTVFGGDAWKAAVPESDEGRSKDALVQIYRDRFKSLGCQTARFDVRVANRTPRYSLILITRHPKGLACWRPVAWHMDPNSGSGAAVQAELQFGPDLQPLRCALTTLAGNELAWQQVEQVAHEAGFTTKHLREVLNDLSSEGLAERISPLTSASQWPETSRIVIFRPEADSEDALIVDGGS